MSSLLRPLARSFMAPEKAGLLVLFEMVAGCGLALFLLARKSLWFDEAASVDIASLDWSSWFDLVSHKEGNMALYYLILRLWLNLGEGEFTVRSLSVVFAVATIPAVFLLAKHMYGWKVGVLAGLIMISNAFWVEYAQEARSYALVMLLATLASYCFVRAVETRRSGYWIAYAVLIALAVYSHTFAGLLVAGHVSSLLFLPRRDVPVRWLVLSGLLIAVLILPMAIFVQSDTGHLVTVGQPTPRTLIDIFNRLSGGQASLLGRGHGFSALPMVAYFLVSLLTMVALARLWLVQRASWQIWRLALPLTWIVVPVVIAFAVSVVRPVLQPRYFAICLPALVLWVSLGLLQLNERKRFALAVLAVIALSLTGVASWYAQDEKQDWRDATAYVLTGAQPNDGMIFFLSSNQIPFDYYRRSLHWAERWPALENYAFPPGSLEAKRHPLFEGFGLQPELDPNLGKRVASKYERVWLVLSQNKDTLVHGNEAKTAEIEAELNEGFILKSERDFHDVTVRLYEKPAMLDGEPH